MVEKLKSGKHWVLLKDRPDPEPEPEKSLPPGRQRIALTVEKRPMGKKATVVGDLVLTAEERKGLARALKSACGCGGTVGDTFVELQGDRGEKVRDWLETRGWRLA